MGNHTAESMYTSPKMGAACLVAPSDSLSDDHCVFVYQDSRVGSLYEGSYFTELSSFMCSTFVDSVVGE